MSLPACQQRVLDHIEKTLQASEPGLAAMYAIFTRLNAGEPVGAESLRRVRVPRRGTAVCAAVLVPVMFAMIAIGALLSGSARGATSCGVTHSTMRGSPWVSHGFCPVGQAAGTRNGQPAPGSATTGGQGHGRAVTRSAGTSCTARMRSAAPHSVSTPPARSPAAALSSGAC
jgi:hypothetical protein